MILYPAYPFLKRLLAIWSQSMISRVKLLVIISTKVDFPQAIPPVNPNILTFLSRYPKRYIKMHGNKVDRKVLIPS